MPEKEQFKEGDVVGSQIDLEKGYIQFYKNGNPLGLAFSCGGSFRKGKLYPFVQLYKTTVSVYQPYQNVQVRVDEKPIFEDTSQPAPQQQMQQPQ